MRLIQGRNNVNTMWVKPRSLDQCRRKNNAFTLSAALRTKILSFSKTEKILNFIIQCRNQFDKQPSHHSNAAD